MEKIIKADSFPKIIVVDTCSYCNLSCSMCFHKDMKRKKGVMAWSLYTRIINEIASEDKNARVWLVFFGEALIIKNIDNGIFDMIRYAKRKGLTDVVLNTNGCLMDEECCKKLIASGLDSIYIGIDAATKETYEKYRVDGDFNKAVKNVFTLAALNTSDLKIYVQFVQMEGNKHEEQAFIDFWSKHNVIVKIRPMVSWGGKVKTSQKKYNNEREACYWAMQSFCITDTGVVVNCAVDLDASLNAGNVKDSSIKEIWNGALKQNRINHIAKNWGALPSICKECQDWQSATCKYVK